jgi:hypothetical protein
MKHLKRFTAIAAAAAALMALAGPASATQLTAPNGTVYTGKVDAASSNFAQDSLNMACTSVAVAAQVEAHGSAATAKLGISALTMSGCAFPVTVKKAGFLEVHTDSTAADGNGRVTWTGLELAEQSPLGECVYTTNGTDVGTITGSDSGNAVWDLNASRIPRTGGTFFCGSTATWTGSFAIGTPATLTVD